jgi:hypothetical protein
VYEGNVAVELIAEATADSDIAGVGQVLITVRMENPVSGFGQFAIVHGVVTQDIDDKHVEVELALSDILQALIVPHTSITTHMKGRIGCCYQSLIPCCQWPHKSRHWWPSCACSLEGRWASSCSLKNKFSLSRHGLRVGGAWGTVGRFSTNGDH